MVWRIFLWMLQLTTARTPVVADTPFNHDWNRSGVVERLGRLLDRQRPPTQQARSRGRAYGIAELAVATESRFVPPKDRQTRRDFRGLRAFPRVDQVDVRVPKVLQVACGQSCAFGATDGGDLRIKPIDR